MFFEETHKFLDIVMIRALLLTGLARGALNSLDRDPSVLALTDCIPANQRHISLENSETLVSVANCKISLAPDDRTIKFPKKAGLDLFQPFLVLDHENPKCRDRVILVDLKNQRGEKCSQLSSLENLGHLLRAIERTHSLGFSFEFDKISITNNKAHIVEVLKFESVDHSADYHKLAELLETSPLRDFVLDWNTVVKVSQTFGGDIDKIRGLKLKPVKQVLQEITEEGSVEAKAENMKFLHSRIYEEIKEMSGA